MRKVKKILNGIMGICLGYYVGHCIFVLWNHYRHPEFYAMQSAPWYTSLWVDGLIVLAAVLAVAAVALFVAFYPLASGAEVPRAWCDAVSWFDNWMWY